MSRSIKKFAPAVIGGLLAGPVGAAAGAGVGSYVSDHNLGKALLSAGGSFVGGNLASSVLGNAGGTLLSGLESTLGPDLGSAAGNLIGSAAFTPISSIVGSTVGSDLASSLVPQKTKNPMGESAGPAPFKPTRDAQKSAPNSFQGLGSLTDMQQGTNLATQGVYGGGLGPEESGYFLNLMNRRLVDDAGNVDTGFGDISGVENSYLAQLGLGGKKTPNDLLQAISTWRA